MKVTHVITSLDVGGAEAMLAKLLSRLDPRECESSVVSLLPEGPIAARIRALDVPVATLGMRHGVPDPRGLRRLVRLLKRDGPDAVQTWMYHADLVGGLAARLAGRIPVAWGIHNAVLETEWSPWSSRATLRACAQLSRRLPQRIICCSEAAARAHIAVGYDGGRMIVIPNGVDVDSFLPDATAAGRLRVDLGIDAGAPTIGLVARFAREKDHQTFARAAGLVLRSIPNARFVLCGSGVDDANTELTGWLDEAGARGACSLLGVREDVPALVPGFDVLALSSITESFPNVLGEAMSCGVPCVTTDVGDAALIVGDTGRVVAARDPEQLAGGLVELLQLYTAERTRLGRAARERVIERFSLASVVARYVNVYEELAST